MPEAPAVAPAIAPAMPSVEEAQPLVMEQFAIENCLFLGDLPIKTGDFHCKLLMLYGGSTVLLSNILDYEIYELGIWFLTKRRQEMIKSFDVAQLSALLGAAGLG